MNLKNTSLLSLLVGLCLASCTVPEVEQTTDGVIVNLRQEQPSDVRKVRLQVMGERLIRVSATPENNFSNRKSLVIVPQSGKTPFAVDNTDKAVEIVTSKVRATVDKTTGEVKFSDLEGNLILAENQGGGKTFTPIAVEGKK